MINRAVRKGLCGVTGVVRHKISKRTIEIINKMSGTAIMIFAVIAYFKR